VEGSSLGKWNTVLKVSFVVYNKGHESCELETVTFISYRILKASRVTRRDVTETSGASKKIKKEG
jgi:hypothetical protein